MEWLENAQMHLCTFTVAQRELMHVCITLNTSATVSNITFLLSPVDSMHFSVQYGIKNCACVISVFITFTTQPTLYKLEPESTKLH